jgi:hypothetical protein
MAEQSMFWPTTGTGDGISGGYTDVRLRDIWKATLGDGILQYQNRLQCTGQGTSTLTIATGAAMVKGYLYENNTSATISTSTLGSQTYGLYIIANESASSLTVSRSVAGTTVAAKTTRLALNLTAPAQPYIKVAEVVTSGGVISSIAQYVGDWANAQSFAYTDRARYLTTTSSISVLNNSPKAPAADATVDSNNVFWLGSISPATFQVKYSGVYLITAQVDWDTNTTNRRQIRINGSGYNDITQLTAASFITATQTTQRAFAVIPISASYGEEVAYSIEIWQDSGTTRTASNFIVDVVRL